MNDTVLAHETQLTRRYRTKYGIPEAAGITSEMVLRHWELEKALTRELLSSSADSRWETFDRCYSTLYGELPWLNSLADHRDEHSMPQRLGFWAEMIGSVPQRVYEIGSGRGELISYLAGLGHQCRASEITRERGEKWASPVQNLSWGISDGVHLDRFEPEGSYDVVLSADVIEHLHPDDLESHFSSARKILRPGGRYILATPHGFVGPSDISSLFDAPEPMGMHLREYAVYELVGALRSAGFLGISFARPMFGPRYHAMFRWLTLDEMEWQSLLERVLIRLPLSWRKRLAMNRRIFPVGKIFLAAANPATDLDMVATHDHEPLSIRTEDADS